MWGIADGQAPWQNVVHYNGRRWVKITSRGLGTMQLQGILALSAQHVWVAGYSLRNGSPMTPALARWAGDRWQQVRMKLPAGTSLSDLSPDGHGGFWLEAIAPVTSKAVALHVSRTGQLTQSKLPVGFSEKVAVIPGTASVWAVGAYAVKNGSVAAIWQRP
jgi:hypothetical protein